MGIFNKGDGTRRPHRAGQALAVAGWIVLSWPHGSQAVDIGKLRWHAAAGQPPYAEIELLGSTPTDLAVLRGRLAARESYDVAGLIYDPRLAGVQASPKRLPDGRVVLRLERLPADAASLDLLVTVSDRISLSLAEFHLNLRQGPFDVAPSPAGTRLSTPTRTASPPQTAPVQAMPGQSAQSAPLPPAMQPADDGIAAARNAVLAWARAWSRRDVDGYLAAYGPGYAGRGDLPSRQAWIAQRRERILARRSIAVEISRMSLVQSGSRVEVRFDQHYRADQFDERVRKHLLLDKVGERWLIVDETELR